MAEDKTVAGFIKSMSTTKTALEVGVLKKVMDAVETTDRGPVSEIIDLAFATTGYAYANIPGGESQVAGHCIAALVKYLGLRALKESPTNESMEESLLALITESVRLYGEVNANRGVRIAAPLTKQERS
jgi:hypothetical protein